MVPGFGPHSNGGVTSLLFFRDLLSCAMFVFPSFVCRSWCGWSLIRSKPGAHGRSPKSILRSALQRVLFEDRNLNMALCHCPQESCFCSVGFGLFCSTLQHSQTHYSHMQPSADTLILMTDACYHEIYISFSCCYFINKCVNHFVDHQVPLVFVMAHEPGRDSNWFSHLDTFGDFPGEPNCRRPQGRPTTCSRDLYISPSPRNIPHPLGSVAEDRDVWNTLLNPLLFLTWLGLNFNSALFLPLDLCLMCCFLSCFLVLFII